MRLFHDSGSRGAILILLRLFVRNFIFGAEAIISARGEICQQLQQNFSPVSRVKISARAEIRHVIRPLHFSVALIEVYERITT